MGRGRKNLKRRHTTKVSRRPKARKVVRAAGGALAVKDTWEPSKTQHENYSTMGLTVNPNTVADVAQYRAGLVVGGLQVDVDEVRALAAVKTSTAGQGSRPPNWMRNDEVEYLQRLVGIHGSNYAAMARDIRTNVLQHSAAHLETRVGRMRRWLADQAMEAAAVAAPAPAAAGSKRQRTEDAPAAKAAAPAAAAAKKPKTVKLAAAAAVAPPPAAAKAKPARRGE